jgi:hypothetical protein
MANSFKINLYYPIDFSFGKQIFWQIASNIKDIDESLYFDLFNEVLTLKPQNEFIFNEGEYDVEISYKNNNPLHDIVGFAIMKDGKYVGWVWYPEEEHYTSHSLDKWFGLN